MRLEMGMGAGGSGVILASGDLSDGEEEEGYRIRTPPEDKGEGG
jgi:hypothetical protein